MASRLVSRGFRAFPQPTTRIRLPRQATATLRTTRALLEKRSPQPPPGPGPAATHALDGKPTGGSFRGQMLETVQARLAREKAERARFIQERSNPSTTRMWATTFSIVFAALFGYWMGAISPKEPDPNSTLKLENSKLPHHKTDDPNLRAAWADFIKIVGRENVNTTDSDLDRHATSEWSSHPTAADLRPFCVVYPKTTEEVSQVMKVCHKRRIPVVGYSGGTSLEGHYEPRPNSVSIDFHHMNDILALHKGDLDVVVQPGVGWEHLNDELEKEGLFFPPDPGPGALIGGMIGTGCSGTNAYRYGTMREWVLSVTAVLADGTVVKTRQRPRKSSAGYDLTKLFVGSEGTLGLVTEATLKLAVRPEHTSVAVATFPSVRHAADAVSHIVAKGVPVAAVEILDDAQMKCINDAGMTSRHWAEKPTLFFKFAGTKNAVKEQVSVVQTLSKKSGGESFSFAKDEHEQHELWSARKEALWSTMAERQPGDKVWTGDVAVPMSRLPDIIEKTKEDMKASGMFGTIVGHVGDGNFHTILLYNEKQRKEAEALVGRMVKRAIEMEGTVTGEHGVGLVKRDYLPSELGQDTVDLMRKLKMAFDPLCLLNCEKIIRIDKHKPSKKPPVVPPKDLK